MIRFRDPINQEPVFFVPHLPEISTEICCRCPIGSKELQTLLRVSQHLRTVVYDIYEKNMKDILKRYANYLTPLNRIISTQPNNPLISFKTTCEIQQSIIQQIKNLGILCPNKHLGLEDIPRFNQAIENLNLQKIWGPIRRDLAVEGKPAENASAQGIRLWMNQNKNHLQNIIWLDLAGKALTTIPREITLLTGLQILGLNNNQITVLPEGIFDQLIQLQVLYLHNNQITVLPEGIFDGLYQLTGLCLHKNQISVLPRGIFAGLNRLLSLFLNNNQITILLQDIFDGLNLLRRLGLSNNQISVLPQGIFDKLNQLRELYLYGNPRLLFSYKDMQTPVLIVPIPALNNDLKAFKEFDAYCCKSPFAEFYKFAAQGNSFNDVMGRFDHLSPYVREIIDAKVQEKQNNSLSFEKRFHRALKKAVRWIFEMSTDERKNVIYTRVLQLAQELDAVKRQLNPGLPPEDFTNPNWGRDHAQDNILRLIDAMSLSIEGFGS